MTKPKTKNEKLFEVKPIEGTPFAILSKDGTHQIIMGNNIAVARDFETDEDAMAFIEEKPWELLLNTIGITIDTINKLNQTNNEHTTN